jgi:hypothetical protein
MQIFVPLYILSWLQFSSTNEQLTSLLLSKLVVDHALSSVKIVLLSIDNLKKYYLTALPMPNAKRPIKSLLLPILPFFLPIVLHPLHLPWLLSLPQS